VLMFKLKLSNIIYKFVIILVLAHVCGKQIVNNCVVLECSLETWLRYDTRCYFNVHSKANMSQLNLPHGHLVVV